MNKLLQERCKTLITQFRKTEKLAIRNQLYDLVSSYILRMIKSSMKKHRKYKTQQELLSMSWDTFILAIKYYDVKHPFPKHLSLCAETILKERLKTEHKHKKRFVDPVVSIDEDDNFSLITPEEGITYDAYMNATIDIQNFRTHLPSNYQIVFDDALHSRGCSNKNKISRMKEAGFAYYRYYESKRVFMILINYFLRK